MYIHNTENIVQVTGRGAHHIPYGVRTEYIHSNSSSRSSGTVTSIAVCLSSTSHGTHSIPHRSGRGKTRRECTHIADNERRSRVPVPSLHPLQDSHLFSTQWRRTAALPREGSPSTLPLTIHLSSRTRLEGWCGSHAGGPTLNQDKRRSGQLGCNSLGGCSVVMPGSTSSANPLTFQSSVSDSTP